MIERPPYQLGMERILRVSFHTTRVGITNMLGAVPYLRELYTDLTEKEGRAILLSWCENWKDIHEEMMKEEDE